MSSVFDRFQGQVKKAWRHAFSMLHHNTTAAFGDARRGSEFALLPHRHRTNTAPISRSKANIV